MVIYYLLLAPCLYLWYSTIFFWLPAYPYGTLPTTFYWPPDYPHCTQLSSTGPLPVSMVLYYLLLAPCLSLWYSTISPFLSMWYSIFYCPSANTYVTLLSSKCSCLSLRYSTIFYGPIAYTNGTLLSSTGPLLIPMILYFLLLAPCLYLW